MGSMDIQQQQVLGQTASFESLSQQAAQMNHMIVSAPLTQAVPLQPMDIQQPLAITNATPAVYQTAFAQVKRRLLQVHWICKQVLMLDVFRMV